ncbi:MAG: PAS domain S-box protein [Candidatus Thermoplasmatota archaeon]|nr:PAS domain S-box protein [Candidatus Thermoplasmatota archaeon]
MTSEPEIVRILREEERLRNSETKSCSDDREQEKKSTRSTTIASNDTLMLFESQQTQPTSLNQEYLDSIYRTVFKTSPLAILVLDPEKRIISWNAYTEHLLKKSKVDLYLQSLASLHSTDEWLRIERKLDEQSTCDNQLVTKILAKDNRELDVEATLHYVKNNDRKHLGFVYIIKDISEQKQAEQYLDSIIQYTDDSMFLLDSNDQYLMVNNTYLSKLGCSREEILGKKYQGFHSTQETEEFRKKLSWVFEHGLPIRDVQCENDQWHIRTISPVQEASSSRTHAVLVILKDITEMKKTEELLLEKENSYRRMFNMFPQCILLVDTNGMIVDTNARVAERTGYSLNEIHEMNLLNASFLTKESQKNIKKAFSRKKLNKKITSLEINVLTKQGEKRLVRAEVSPVVNDTGDTLAHLVILSDSFKRKYTEGALRRKDNAIASSVNAIAFMNLEGNLTYANESFLRMWGYATPDEIIGKPMVQFWKMKDQFNEVMDALNTNGNWIGNLTGIRKDKSVFQVQLSANLIKGDGNNPIGIIFSYGMKTQNQKVINALNENEKRFEVVLQNSLDMMYQFNIIKETYDYISPSSVKIVGYSPEELISFPLKKIDSFIHPEDYPRWTQHRKTMSEQQQKENAIQSIEYRFKHKKRGYRWIRDTCSTIFDEKNEPVYIVGTLEDITDRKKIWEQLVKSEENYRILAETSADGVFTTDSLGRLTYVNPSFEKLCGRRKSQILATPFRKYLLEDSVYFFQQIFIDVRKKNDKIENVELELVSGNCDIIPIEVNIAPLTKQTEFGGVVCTVRDITQRREIEDVLKKNERLKTEFMNIAAHELRSPVTPIKGYLDLIIHDNESNEKIKNWAKISLRNAERLLKLVNDILDVARLDSDTMRFDMEKIDPAEFLNEIVEDMRPAIMNKKLEFHVNIQTQLPHIIGDKNRLSQVMKNLIGNALKFTDCGYIGVEAEKNNNYIQIAVVDTGIGISKDELKKIFTKFYQAYTGEDRNNEGTGLGLFISKEIIKKHNGSIWVESEVGKGSRFIIQLPYVYKMIVDFET